MHKLNSLVRTFVSCLVVITFLVGGVGCAGKLTRNPLPLEFTNEAVISGIPDARFWADEWPKFSQKKFAEFTDEDFQLFYPGIYNKPHNYLAISGGGANGAFGAGLLGGWTAAGTRPEFTMVTGISTGALTAPFAFLGPDYDDEMKEVYTTTTTRVRVRGRGRVRVRGRGRGSVRVRVRPGGGLQVGSLYPDPSTYPYSYCYP